MTVTVTPTWGSFDNFSPYPLMAKSGAWPTHTRLRRSSLSAITARSNPVKYLSFRAVSWLACYQKLHALAQDMTGRTLLVFTRRFRTSSIPKTIRVVSSTVLPDRNRSHRSEHQNVTPALYRISIPLVTPLPGHSCCHCSVGTMDLITAVSSVREFLTSLHARRTNPL